MVPGRPLLFRSLDRLVHVAQGLPEEVVDQRHEGFPGELQARWGLGSEFWEHNFGLLVRAQLDLGGLGVAADDRPESLIFLDQGAEPGRKLADGPIGDGLIEVRTAEALIPGTRHHVHVVQLSGDDGHVEGAPTQVVNQINALFGFELVSAVTDGGGRGFGDELSRVQACQKGRIFGGSSLFCGEVGRNGNDRVTDLMPQMGLRDPFHLLEDESADLLRPEPFVAEGNHQGIPLLGIRRQGGPPSVVLVYGLFT